MKEYLGVCEMYKQVLTILLNFNILIQIDDTFVSHIDNILNREHGTELGSKTTLREWSIVI